MVKEFFNRDKDVSCVWHIPLSWSRNSSIETGMSVVYDTYLYHGQGILQYRQGCQLCLTHTSIMVKEFFNRDKDVSCVWHIPLSWSRNSSIQTGMSVVFDTYLYHGQGILQYRQGCQLCLTHTSIMVKEFFNRDKDVSCVWHIPLSWSRNSSIQTGMSVVFDTYLYHGQGILQYRQGCQLCLTHTSIMVKEFFNTDRDVSCVWHIPLSWSRNSSIQTGMSGVFDTYLYHGQGILQYRQGCQVCLTHTSIMVKEFFNTDRDVSCVWHIPLSRSRNSSIETGMSVVFDTYLYHGQGILQYRQGCQVCLTHTSIMVKEFFNTDRDVSCVWHIPLSWSRNSSIQTGMSVVFDT